MRRMAEQAPAPGVGVSAIGLRGNTGKRGQSEEGNTHTLGSDRGEDTKTHSIAPAHKPPTTTPSLLNQPLTNPKYEETTPL